MDLVLNQLTVDPSLQPRVGGLDPTHICSLEETPDAWPPVVVVQQGDGYLLIDGFHRLAAAQNIGRDTISAEVIDPPADGDLRALAFTMNLGHGKPLSLDDRRVEAHRLLQRTPEVSNMELSRRVGLAPTTIATIRSRLEADAAIPANSQRIGRGGYTYNPAASRQPGELSRPGIGETLGGMAATFLSTKERQQQRTWTNYLKRVSEAVGDLYELPDWQGTEKLVAACRIVLGDDKSRALAEELGPASEDLLTVAHALGYEPEDEAE